MLYWFVRFLSKYMDTIDDIKLKTSFLPRYGKDVTKTKNEVSM